MPLQPFGAPTPTPTARPRVRRAQPVTADSAAGSPTPAEPPTARAVPFDSPAPGGAAPSRRYPRPGDNGPVEPTAAVPDAAPTSTGQQPQTAEPKTTPPRIRPHGPPPTDSTDNGSAAAATPGDEDSGEIRIAPHAPGAPTVSAEDQQFNLAGDYYLRKEYTQAAAEYERYLGQFPNGKQRQAAYWWLGESYRLLKKPTQARSAYQQLVIAFQEGEFVGSACLRMASMDYEAKDYRTALPLFQRAASLAPNDAVRLLARYYEAVCLEQTGRREDTRQVYEEILTVTKDNPYRDDAHLALARLALDQHHPNEAFKEYEALSREATRPGLQAEASLKAGLIAKDLGQSDSALPLLARAVSLSGNNTAVRAEAQLTELHLLYDTNKYKALLEAYPGIRPGLPAASQPEAMLLAANSDRQLGKGAEARAIYDEILDAFPRSPQVPEARYQRIISLYASNDPNFVKEADLFLGSGAEPVKIDEVRLMKADTLFKGGDYTGAALAYGALDGSTNLPAKYKAEAAYRLGYCYAQAGKPEQTVAAFSKFLRAYPESPLAAKALVQRAGAYEKLQNYPSALADFNEVINDHKDAKERENAFEHKALILGQQHDNRGMAEAFRALLKDYPKTEIAALAHYSIGRAAYEDDKDYGAALTEFTAARAADPKEYGAKSAYMAIVCEYQLKDRPKLTADVAAYQKAKGSPDVPPSILLWLGEQEYDEKNYGAAEGHLASATASLAGKGNSEAWLMLARARVYLEKWDGALEASQKYLAGSSPEPRERALGLLVQGEAQVALKRFDDAQKTVDETLQLQPEGSLNAKARLLGGKLLFAQGKYDEAAKAYRSIAVLYDDKDITPVALSRAAEAFDKAGRPDDAKKANDELRAKYPTYTAEQAL
ncbi:MAG: tetratricopeptide repeat protein [Caulobacteraceae bacterium]|nr:tetratricopeptide repeat protein [Caulobacter sp.]